MQTRGEVHFFERGNFFYHKIQIWNLKTLLIYVDDYYEKGIEYYRSKMPKASDDQVVLAKVGMKLTVTVLAELYISVREAFI